MKNKIIMNMKIIKTLLLIIVLLISCSKKMDKVEILISDLNFADKYIQMETIEKLANTEDPRAIEPITKCLISPHEEVRITAVNALEKLKAPASIDDLILCLDDGSRSVRRNAINALKGFGNEAVETLIASTKSEDWKIRSGAAETLGEIGNEKAVDSLIFLLDDKNEDVRLEAVVALGKIGPTKSIQYLEKLKQKEVKQKNSKAVKEIQNAIDKIRK
ncbi:MAG: HEAT repeat domain-containing protein [Candidatus Cloacimonetes bacterium]|nr:HEAT repeat domain-containing protein [Candidatus Cloacimonadota bacterium]MBS3766534.1 HEAT repeat domain-containing protein [Candidatus Cloacimonadota bacterium]